MRFDFGENIKALRRQRDLTQEQAAELLNVSKQSVSRWETGTSYPDIMFLPVLASFYGVTVDSLLGADHERNEAAIDEYRRKRQSDHHTGCFSDAFELSQKMYASFPNNKTVINALMVDSHIMGLHSDCEKRKYYLEISISAAERFMKMTDDIEEQCRCIGNISSCHKLMGNNEEAAEWMQKLPSMWSGIEAAALNVLEGEEKADSIRCTLDIILHFLYRMLTAYADESCDTKNDSMEVIEKLPRIFKIIFEKGDLGFYHAFASRSFVKLSNLSENRDRSVFYAAEAITHARSFDDLKDSSHSSLIFRGFPISPAEYTSKDGMTESERVRSEIPRDIYEEAKKLI